jgi:hypothetical protein
MMSISVRVCGASLLPIILGGGSRRPRVRPRHHSPVSPNPALHADVEINTEEK